VTFNVGMRDDYGMLTGLRRILCVLVLTRTIVIIITFVSGLKRYGYHRTSVSGDINEHEF
jgi:hypothetical protein